MEISKLQSYRELYRNELFESSLPFWTRSSLDKEYGGYFSCLDREGTIYSTDKSVWIQGRSLWLFSRLCNQYGARDEWINIAKSCREFLDKYCFDKDGRMFFQVTRDGSPVRKRRYFFSETFYIIGCVEYYKLTGDISARDAALKVFKMVMDIVRDKSNDPFFVPEKFCSQTRGIRGLSSPMILLNVVTVMRECDPDNAQYYDACGKELLADIFKYFYKEELHTIFETVGENGETYDFPMYRTINPGHAIEASWFIIRAAQMYGCDEYIPKALNVYDWSFDYGWDREFGGILYFVDVKGFPPEQYEHEQKLWWPMNEACIASLTAYDVSPKEKYLDWFEKCTEYSFTHFKDEKCGDWVGYLTRRGEWILPATKGNMYKSGFHLIRMLMECDALLEKLISKG